MDEALLRARGVPARLRALVAPDVLRDTPAVSAARELDSGILVLSGPKGAGKTVAAAWLVAEHDRSARFARAQDLARLGLYDVEGLQVYTEPDLLVLDDLGVEYSDRSGAFRALLDDLVNRRYDELRTTVITTNLRASGFRERYGERVADRIREVGRFVELDGESMRTRQHGFAYQEVEVSPHEPEPEPIDPDKAAAMADQLLEKLSKRARVM